jgi:hypothetical protein
MKRIFNCTGITIPLPGRWQVEVWWCPRGAVIPPHTHPHVISHIAMLAGRMRWRVGSEVREVCGPFRRRQTNGRLAWSAYRVEEETVHGATVTGLFGLFLNLERWTGKKTSAATDLRLV